MLAESKLDSTKALISQALIDLEISRQELQTILIEKEKYERMKEDIRITNSSDELGEKTQSIRENCRNA